MGPVPAPKHRKAAFKVQLDERTKGVLRGHADAAGVPMAKWLRAAILEKAAREDADQGTDVATRVDHLAERVGRIERHLELGGD